MHGDDFKNPTLLIAKLVGQEFNYVLDDDISNIETFNVLFRRLGYVLNSGNANQCKETCEIISKFLSRIWKYSSSAEIEFFLSKIEKINSMQDEFLLFFNSEESDWEVEILSGF